MSLALRLIGALQDLLAGQGDAVEPPPPPAEQAAKGLRKLVQQASSSEATPEQAQLGQRTITELVNAEVHTRCLCAVVALATERIHTIDTRRDLDTAESGLMRWGHLRVNALAVLLHIASSEARSVRLLEGTEGGASAGAASIALDLLASNAARVDAEGVSVAANLLRNLLLPHANRPVIGALRGGELLAFAALVPHAGHADAAVAAIAAASLRILVEGCPANAERCLAVPSGAPLAPLARLDPTNVHPHARAEIARFACAVMAAAMPTNTTESVRTDLTAAGSLGFPAFLLSAPVPRHARSHSPPHVDRTLTAR